MLVQEVCLLQKAVVPPLRSTTNTWKQLFPTESCPEMGHVAQENEIYCYRIHSHQCYANVILRMYFPKADCAQEQ